VKKNNGPIIPAEGLFSILECIDTNTNNLDTRKSDDNFKVSILSGLRLNSLGIFIPWNQGIDEVRKILGLKSNNETELVDNFIRIELSILPNFTYDFSIYFQPCMDLSKLKFSEQSTFATSTRAHKINKVSQFHFYRALGYGGNEEYIKKRFFEIENEFLKLFGSPIGVDENSILGQKMLRRKIGNIFIDHYMWWAREDHVYESFSIYRFTHRLKRRKFALPWAH
jgi:hypothetical protein